MTPVERLQAAIDVVEEVRAAATPGVWKRMHTVPGVVWSEGDAVAEFPNRADAELVATTSRLLEPQLAWLKDEADRMRADENQDGIRIRYRHALAVADAILGETAL